MAEAARLLGRSQRTVRRWIADGKLAVDRSGPVIVVDVGGHVTGTDTTTADVTGEVDRLLAEVARLRADLADVRAERDSWRVAFEREQALAMSLSSERLLLGERAGERPRRRWRWQFWRPGDEA